jgi:hypothetical protein
LLRTSCASGRPCGGITRSASDLLTSADHVSPTSPCRRGEHHLTRQADRNRGFRERKERSENTSYNKRGCGPPKPPKPTYSTQTSEFKCSQRTYTGWNPVRAPPRCGCKVSKPDADGRSRKTGFASSSRRCEAPKEQRQRMRSLPNKPCWGRKCGPASLLVQLAVDHQPSLEQRADCPVLQRHNRNRSARLRQVDCQRHSFASARSVTPSSFH